MGSNAQMVLRNLKILIAVYFCMLAVHCSLLLHGYNLMSGYTILLLSKQHPVELDGMRNCHIRDGAAVISYLCWLDAQVSSLTLE